MNRRDLIAALVLFNLAVFALTVAFLPRPSSFSYQTGNPIDYLIASRYHWDIAWEVLAASVLLSAAYYVATAARQGQRVFVGDAPARDYPHTAERG
jgi:hypothetical protein